MAEFQPGLYRHYKGSLYRAIALVVHHEDQVPMVLYVALEHPESLPQVREFDSNSADSWNDWVDERGCAVADRRPGDRRRFEYVSP
jgi:hypothetical protein